MGVDSEKDEFSFDDFVMSDDPIQIQEKEEDEEVVDDTKKSDDTEEEEESGKDEESDEGELDDDQDEDEDDIEEEESDDDEQKDEGNGFKSIIELMHEQNGWEYKDEDFPDDSVEGLNDFIREIVDSNSEPKFASDESKRFNDFIAKYGIEKAGDFLETNFGNTDYSEFKADNETQAKTLMRDYLKETTKFSDKKIEKQIEKADELGELEDEFEEMQEFMISSHKKKAEDLERIEEEAKVAKQQEFQGYLNSQKDRIDSAKEIAGFELNEKDKDGLFKFAYEQGRDGKTGYQKLRESDTDLDLKLLWLAYKGVDKAKISKDAESNVAKRLKKQLSRHSDSATGSNKGAGAPKKSNSKKSNGSDYSAFVLNK